MFVLPLIDGLCALTCRRGRRRAVGTLALFAALLHGAVWPLLAVSATASDSDGWQFIEICTSDGTKLVPVADGLAPPAEAPIPIEHSECAACVCAANGCGGSACPTATEIVFYDPGDFLHFLLIKTSIGFGKPCQQGQKKLDMFFPFFRSSHYAPKHVQSLRYFHVREIKNHLQLSTA